jgi:protein-tyrosine sulfotransferase
MPRSLTPEHDFALVVGAARSGTTLLRLILDAHPDVGCPAEAGIPGLIADLGRVWWMLDADRVGDQGEDPQTTEEARIGTPAKDGGNGAGIRHSDLLPDLSARAKQAIRQAALAPMLYYCEREGKRIYCDKSLDSVYHLEAVRQIFPETRYVLLFRHVMDAVASGLEASPWGFQAYGYLPFVQRSPENFVVALVNYWLSHVDGALRWEEAHPELCHRVRYEDLVAAPEDVVSGLFEFLGVEWDLSVLPAAFKRARVASGPGDYKVTYTSTVDAASVGRGKRVPVGMIPPPLLEAVNAKLTELGYESLTKAWNAEPVARAGHDGGMWSARLVELMGAAQPTVGDENDGAVDSFAVVAQDHEQLRWVINPAMGSIRQGDGEVESVVTGTTEDLVLLLSGEVNPGVLMRSGRIRHVTAAEGVSPDVVAREMRFVLEVLRDGRVRVDGSKTGPPRFDE